MTLGQLENALVSGLTAESGIDMIGYRRDAEVVLEIKMWIGDRMVTTLDMPLQKVKYNPVNNTVRLLFYERRGSMGGDTTDIRVLRQEVRVARKEHRCVDCDKPIQKGQTYKAITAIVDEMALVTGHFHMECWHD